MGSHNLPPQPTPFIGRETEINEIVSLLDDPACRLLTLVGPGGIGKTRLAIEVAAQMVEAFADGVFFVDLQPVSAADYLVPTFAEALGITLYGQDEPRAQLLRAIRDTSQLLVVDNFEHLLDGVDLLTAILDAAPAVRLLVTSRAILNIQAEWLYAVHGLRFPSRESITVAEPYDAVQLFATRAHQVRRDFSLTDDLHHAIRICQLVEGMPLALELAANWLKTVPCAEVAAEIGRGLDFLAITMRDLPQRHRSMWAVFAPTWNRLADAERDAFMRLSVFHGGFSREAAEQVAGASLAMLSQLADQSLLRLTDAGRYRMHELMRQYAEDQLRDDSHAWHNARDRHCDYFARFLHGLEPEMKSSGQLAALPKIEEEIDNVRVAWRWAVGQKMEEKIEKSLDSLALFYHIRCWYQEAEEAFRMVVEGLGNERSVVRGQALMWQAHFLDSSGGPNSSERAIRLLQEGASVLRDLAAYGTTAMPLWLLSEFTDNPEMLEEIKQFCLDNLVNFRKSGDRWGTAWALLGLGNVPLLEGTYEEAHEYSQEALAIFREVGDQLGMAAALQALIKVAHGQGAYLEQKRYAQEALTLAKTIGDRGGIAAGQLAMGRAAYKLGAYGEARQVLEQSLTLFKKHFPEDVAPIVILGEVALALGNHHHARHYLREALQGVPDDSKRMVWVTVAIAKLLAAVGHKEQAVELLAATTYFRRVLRFSDHAEVTTLFAELETDLLPEVFAAARRRGETADLRAMASAVLDELSELDLSRDGVFPTGVYSRRSGQALLTQPLIEPLTEREREVLALIIEGYANREIADRLYIGVSTVKKHINHIYGKLGVDSRSRAIARARELELF